jgi:hypothetical protein
VNLLFVSMYHGRDPSELSREELLEVHYKLLATLQKSIPDSVMNTSKVFGHKKPTSNSSSDDEECIEEGTDVSDCKPPDASEGTNSNQSDPVGSLYKRLSTLKVNADNSVDGTNGEPVKTAEAEALFSIFAGTKTYHDVPQLYRDSDKLLWFTSIKERVNSTKVEAERKQIVLESIKSHSVAKRFKDFNGLRCCKDADTMLEFLKCTLDIDESTAAYVKLFFNFKMKSSWDVFTYYEILLMLADKAKINADVIVLNVFRNGLSEKIRNKLNTYPDADLNTLKKCYDKARRVEFSLSHNDASNTSANVVKCLYCGLSGHYAVDCRSNPASAKYRSTNSRASSRPSSNGPGNNNYGNHGNSQNRSNANTFRNLQGSQRSNSNGNNAGSRGRRSNNGWRPRGSASTGNSTQHFRQ